MADFVTEMKRQQAALHSADAAAKAKGTLVGRYIEHPFADGHAVYTIVGVTATKAQIEVVEIGDAWVLPAWGRKASIALAKAKSMVASRDAMSALFKQRDDWWANQPVGAVVHYTYSDTQFVRGVIVEDGDTKKMRPIALLGKGWRQHDTFTRQADGSISYGYHVKAIRAGELMQPNAANMVEHPNHRLRGDDPRTLAPIAIEPPPPTPAEVRLAEVAKKHAAVLAALTYERSNDPEIAAAAIKAALARATALLG